MTLSYSTIGIIIILVSTLYILSTSYQFRMLARAQKKSDDYIEDLKSAHEHMNEAFALSKSCMFQFDLIENTLQIEAKYFHYLGIPATLIDSGKTELVDYLNKIMPKDAVKLLHLLERVQSGAIHEFVEQIQLTTGVPPHWLEIRFSVSTYDEGGRPAMGTGFFTNISSTKRLEQHFKQLLHYDGLTNLPNRYFLKDHINKDIRKNGEHLKAAGIMLDIDNFKLINDTLGHDAGDIYLKLIANILESAKEQNTFIARLEGDEFFVYVWDYASAADVDAYAQRLLDKICREAELDFLQFTYIRASAGIAMLDLNGKAAKESADVLMQNAETAMYYAKKSGKNCLANYTDTMDVEIIENYQLFQDIRQAFERQEFELYFQPVISLSADRVIELEALVRWNHPQKGIVLPGQFIQLTEMTGEINRLGNYVIEHSLRILNTWKNTPLERMLISINVSPTQLLQENFAETVEYLFKVYSVPYHQVQLEITENVMVDRSGITQKNIARLKDLGMSIALDDFGMEYSSLSMLNSIPFDVFKIDKYFIQHYQQGPASQEVFHMVSRLAEKYKKAVIVEGVETEEQLEIIRSLGYELVQGFYYSRPLPADEIVDFVRRRAVRR